MSFSHPPSGRTQVMFPWKCLAALPMLVPLVLSRGVPVFGSARSGREAQFRQFVIGIHLNDVASIDRMTVSSNGDLHLRLGSMGNWTIRDGNAMAAVGVARAETSSNRVEKSGLR